MDNLKRRKSKIEGKRSFDVLHACVDLTGPPCKVKPWPKCDLGTYFMNKWNKYYEYLDTLPPISFCGSKEKWQAILEEERQKLKEKLGEEEGGDTEDSNVKTERVREMLAEAK